MREIGRVERQNFEETTVEKHFSVQRRSFYRAACFLLCSVCVDRYSSEISIVFLRISLDGTRVISSFRMEAIADFDFTATDEVEEISFKKGQILRVRSQLSSC